MPGRDEALGARGSRWWCGKLRRSRRCLGFLEVKDVRLGLNEVSEEKPLLYEVELDTWVREWKLQQ